MRPGGFPVNLVTLAGDGRRTPGAEGDVDPYSSTSDATIVKLRKEIRDKANKRECELRSTS